MEDFLMEEQKKFKCLRCGHEFTDGYDRKVMKERACPKCNSNSVRLNKKS